MRFSQEFIEKIQESNNLIDLVSQYTQLKPTGSGLMGRCPFPDHQEKTPSFSVSETKQVYYCFGCHKKGNIFTFLKEFYGMAFPQAVEFLAQRANISLPKNTENDGNSSTESSESRKKKEILELNKEALMFFKNQLKQSPQNSVIYQYLQSRGINEDTVNLFSIGFADSNWEGLVRYFDRKNFNLSIAEEARLIKSRKDENNGYFDLFRDRLIFPIISPSGQPIGFGGRIIGQGEPKYLNSPETPVFHKGRVLYGLDQTARYIRSEDFAVLVEGYMDLLSLFQAGMKNGAATMGTALTSEHAKALKRITKNVVVLFDGDSAGIEAAEKSLPILLAADLYPKCVILPQGKDPDEFIREQGFDVLNDLVKKAPDLFSRVLDIWATGFRGEASEKIKLIDKVRPVLEMISDPRLRQLYFEEVAHRLSVHFHWLNQALNYRSTKENKPYNKPESSNKKLNLMALRENVHSSIQKSPSDKESEIISLKGASKAELNLLKLALKSRANFDLILKENVLENILNHGVLLILKKAEEVYGQDPTKFDRLVSRLISYVDQPEVLFWNEEINHFQYEAESEIKLVKDCIKRVRETFLRDRAKNLTLDFRLAFKESQEMDPDALEKIMNLQRNRISLNKIDKN